MKPPRRQDAKVAKFHELCVLGVLTVFPFGSGFAGLGRTLVINHFDAILRSDLITEIATEKEVEWFHKAAMEGEASTQPN